MRSEVQVLHGPFRNELRELARRADITHATVNRIENGKVASLDLTVLEKLAKALEVDAGYLIVTKGK